MQRSARFFASLIVPACQISEFIGEALESVFAQPIAAMRFSQ